VQSEFSTKEIDNINHRFIQKGKGELGIYLIDGIIIRVARVKRVRVKEDNKLFEKQESDQK
jgi:hypothetical protein